MSNFSIFRVTLEVSDLDKASSFYATLLDQPGRSVRGSRHYFDCGSVILAILDPSPGGRQATPNSDNFYFAVDDLEAVYQRARQLSCLATDDVHGASAGQITRRPWGELSFYVTDPWGNSLCFVDSKTIFDGKRS